MNLNTPVGDCFYSTNYMKPFNCSSPFAWILHWNTISIIAAALFVKYKNISTCSVKKVKCEVTVQSIFAVESLSRHIDSGDHALKSLKWLKIDYSATSSMHGSAASLYTITYKHFCKIFDVIQTSIWLSFAANPYNVCLSFATKMSVKQKSYCPIWSTKNLSIFSGSEQW